MIARRADLNRALRSTCAELGDEEIAVLGVLARRLLLGQKQYGLLNLADADRDWRKERAEELADSLVYGAFSEIAATLKK
jgi:hypothetical protein